MDLTAYWLILSALGQIDAEACMPDRFCEADLQKKSIVRELNNVMVPAGYGIGEICEFSIQPYLQVARDLQQLPEVERVRQLAKWARVESLSVPVMLLCRMLIERRDGSPLRAPRLGSPLFVLEGSNEDFPDSPFLFCGGIPFHVVAGYGMGGEEPAIEYLKYALSVGKWRQIAYDVVKEETLNEIAKEFIGRYKARDRKNVHFEKWIMSQVGPPHPEVESVTSGGNMNTQSGTAVKQTLVPPASGESRDESAAKIH